MRKRTYAGKASCRNKRRVGFKPIRTEIKNEKEKHEMKKNLLISMLIAVFALSSSLTASPEAVSPPPKRIKKGEVRQVQVAPRITLRIRVYGEFSNGTTGGLIRGASVTVRRNGYSGNDLGSCRTSQNGYCDATVNAEYIDVNTVGGVYYVQATNPAIHTASGTFQVRMPASSAGSSQYQIEVSGLLT